MNFANLTVLKFKFLIGVVACQRGCLLKSSFHSITMIEQILPWKLIDFICILSLSLLAAISSSLYRLSTRLIISHHDNEEKSFHFSFAL